MKTRYLGLVDDMREDFFWASSPGMDQLESIFRVGWIKWRFYIPYLCQSRRVYADEISLPTYDFCITRFSKTRVWAWYHKGRDLFFAAALRKENNLSSS